MLKIKPIIIFTIAISIILRLFSFFEMSTFVEASTRKSFDNAETLIENRSNSNNSLILGINSAINDFENYINIVGMNVSDKNSIDLPTYDPNYIYPTFADVSYDYFIDISDDFSIIQNSYFEDILDDNVDISTHFNLVCSKFIDVEITPVFYLGIVRSAALTSLWAILSGLAVPNEVLVAFVGCLSSLISFLELITVPVLVVLGSLLIAAVLVTIIAIFIEYWDEFNRVLNDIWDWFLDTVANSVITVINAINDFFNYIISAFQASSTIGTLTIGNVDFDQREISFKDTFSVLSIIGTLYGTTLIALFGDVNVHNFIFLGFVDFDFCVEYQTHKNGFSSYTWFESQAENLILQAGSGYTDDAEINNRAIYNVIYMYHFHNYQNVNGVLKRADDPPILKKTHSFYGSMYIGSENGRPIVHPDSPLYVTFQPGGGPIN